MRLLGLITLGATLTLAACGGSGGGAPTTPAPVVTMAVSPTTLNSGNSATLTWSATNASSCTASNGWAGQQAVSGTQDTGPLTTNTVYVLSCTGAGGTSPNSSATVNIVPTATLTATPNGVAPGAGTTLTWTSTNATSCTASGGWSGTQPTSGTIMTPALNGATSFSLVCTGDGGNSAAATVGITVSPVPTATLSAAPTAVTAGTRVTLAWSSTDATACMLSDGTNDTAVPPSGTQASPALSANTTFTLTCTGAGGSAVSALVAVTVTPITPPPANSAQITVFSGSQASVTKGSAATLSWSSINATACTLQSGVSTAAVAVAGTQSTGALNATTTFTLICSGAGGASAPAMVTVTVAGTAEAKLTASANPVASGSPETISWTSTNATSCTLQNGTKAAQTVATTGSQGTGSFTTPSTYILICTGPSGAGTPAVLTINVIPTATLTATPATVASGGAATLKWASTNATACTAAGSPGFTGALSGVNGTQSTGAITTNTTYAVVCTGAGGNSTPATATVTLTQAPVVTISANPSTIASGGTSTLTWSSTGNATSCTASGGWSGAQTAAGAKATAALTATTTYTLACSNASGAGPAASATVVVGTANGTGAVVPKAAQLTLTRAQQFTTTVPDTATWTVDGVTGGSAASGTVDSSGLYTAGSAVGQHTVTATSSADHTKTASATVAVTDLAGIYSYHNNQSRDGSNLKEYALTKANVASGFGKLASCAVDGAVYAQPLWVANVNIGGIRHNVVYVATEHDGLWAFDAEPVGTTCAQLWSMSLIDKAHGANDGETTVPSSPSMRYVGIGAGDIQPEIGITGTPVIDPASGILYVVTKSMSADKATYYQRLHAIDITSGNEKAGSPLLITGSYPGSGDNGTTVTFNTQQHLQRTGLSLGSDGTVYVAFTAHEDKSPWYGWIMSYQYAGNALTLKNTINVAPNSRQGGIWMSGGAPAMDAGNNLYFLTGNGVFNVNTGGKDYGNSLMKLGPDLKLSGYFTPSSEVDQGTHDNDLGAGGAAILADLPEGSEVVHTIIFGGKESQIFIVDRDNPPGYGDQGALQKIAFGSAIFSTGAVWNGKFFLAGNTTSNGQLKAYKLDLTGATSTTLAGKSAHTYSFPGATPSISAAGTANGIVWTLDTGGAYCTHQTKAGCKPVTLYAHDADDVSKELWNSSKNAADAAGYPVKFNLPTVANGHVYVGTRGNDCSESCAQGVTPTVLGTVDIYGLKP